MSFLIRCRAWLGSLALMLVLGLGSAAAAAAGLTQPLAWRMAAGEGDERVAALQEAVALADPEVAAFIRAMLADEVKVDADRAYVLVGDRARPVGVPGAAEQALPDDAQDAVVNNRLRREFEGALAVMGLLAPERELRARAIADLKGPLDASLLPLLRRAEAAETDPVLKARLAVRVAGSQLAAEDPAERLRAAEVLAASADPAVRALLIEQRAVETDARVRAALGRSLSAVESRLAWGERLGALFSGISLGSILMLAALGLAITYGLMGVINMAHGELIMIGAYATYLVQNLVRAWAPAAFDAYVLLAIPVSFLVTAAVGAALERSVIRWLYGRPLETLLATWGISLILMQSVRSLFGAQNVAVENPSWLSGGLEVLPNLILPWNRLAVLAFASLVLLAVAVLIGRTRLGLFVRGVTQNRRMASCVGVNTARIDTWAFSLGAGVAGLAGCALSQLGNVGPDLGQSYIVDSFMVVVLGGVGQLAGTVYAGLGLGVLNKLLEGWQGAVLAKIMVLMFIVVFIQRRPQGLFALKGRSAES